MPREQIALTIPQLKHARTVAIIENALGQFPDIREFSADIDALRVCLSHDTESSSAEAIIAALRELGLDARLVRNRGGGFWSRLFGG